MKKILVINNDFDTMSLLKSWLEKKSYTVMFTGNEDTVISLMCEFEPQLVIIDVLQKDIIEKIKSKVKTRSVPLLLMTGYTLRQNNTQLPVDDTIEKPFNLPLLIKKIEKLIPEDALMR